MSIILQLIAHPSSDCQRLARGHNLTNGFDVFSLIFNPLHQMIAQLRM